MMRTYLWKGGKEKPILGACLEATRGKVLCSAARGKVVRSEDYELGLCMRDWTFLIGVVLNRFSKRTGKRDFFCYCLLIRESLPLPSIWSNSICFYFLAPGSVLKGNNKKILGKKK
jgi:hypothetical protein